MDRYGNGESIELEKVFKAETCKPSFRDFDMELFTGVFSSKQCVLNHIRFLIVYIIECSNAFPSIIDLTKYLYFREYTMKYFNGKGLGCSDIFYKQLFSGKGQT